MDQRINEEIVKLTEGTQGAFQAISRRFDGLDEKQKILDRRLTQVERKLDRIVHLLEQQTVQAAQPAAPPAVAGNEEANDSSEPTEEGGAGEEEEPPLPEHEGK